VTALVVPARARPDERHLIAQRALTVRPPWSDWITRGKGIENRGWTTTWRGTLLIHAGKHWDAEPAVRGAVVGVARLHAIHMPGPACTVWCQASAAYHWELQDVHRLRHPVYCAGSLSLWVPSPELLHRVRAGSPGLARTFDL
jgi:hypothetical protein